jgi:hypothetical protein
MSPSIDIWSKLMIFFLIIFILTLIFLKDMPRYILGIGSLLLIILSCVRMSFDKVVLVEAKK